MTHLQRVGGDKYRVVEWHNAEALATEVNRLISEGWQPLGGVVVIGYDGSPRFWAQAMVKP